MHWREVYNAHPHYSIKQTSGEGKRWELARKAPIPLKLLASIEKVHSPQSWKGVRCAYKQRSGPFNSTSCKIFSKKEQVSAVGVHRHLHVQWICTGCTGTSICWPDLSTTCLWCLLGYQTWDMVEGLPKFVWLLPPAFISYSISLIMIWMTGQSIHSTNFLMTWDWEEKPIHQRVVVPSRGMLTA